MGPTEKQLANLIKFTKGASGNRNGRGRGSFSLTGRLKEVLANEELGDAVVLATIKHLIKGNPAAIKIIWDRHDGLQSKPIEVTTQEATGLGMHTLTDSELDELIASAERREASEDLPQ